MKLTAIPATLLTVALAGTTLGQTETKGKIDAVTVYRGQALVTRVIDVGTANGGLQEIVVTDLPPAIAAESLYAEAEAGIEVRSVRYRQRAVAQDSREDVRKLESEVRTLADQLETTRGKIKQIDWQRAYLDKVENFVTGTAVVENGKGVLNAETLTKMTDHLTTQRTKVTDDARKLQLEARDLEEQLNLKQRDLNQLNARGNRTAREATIFVNAPQGGKLRVSYIVSNATWSPSYNLRAPATPNGNVSIEYQASVQQVSGEDWGDVKMTLSTATPALVAAAPSLQPMTLALAAPAQSEIADQLKSLGYKQAKEQVQAMRDELNRSRLASGNTWANKPMGQATGGQAGGAPLGDGAWDRRDAELFAGNLQQADKAINDNSKREQLLDFLSAETITRAKDSGEARTPAATEGVSVAYTLASRTSLPSRDDQQLIQIAKSDCRSDFYRVATPVLSSFVYNEGAVTNTGSQLLLAGPSASYSDGEFVGRGVIPTTAVGQQFIAGFGNDSSLRTSRELVDRTERTQGGNRVVEFTYRLTVENFGKTPAKVRLMDRIPVTKGNDIRVELIKPGTLPPSSDPVYNADQRPKGILRWDVEVPAGTSADKPFAVEYTFRVEYDRQMTITEVPGK